MEENNDLAPSHLGANKSPIWWDWWSENPTEVIVVVFILVFFFLIPRAGCGVTQVGMDTSTATNQAGQP